MMNVMKLEIMSELELYNNNLNNKSFTFTLFYQ